jgi:hypothetical protein
LLALAGGASLFSLMGVGALDKEKSKQKNQDAFKLAERSDTKSSLVHLAQVFEL